jgi:hypothetical protein
MKIIYVESAYSYGGPVKTSSVEEVFNAYMAVFKPDSVYSVVDRKEISNRKPKCTVLKGYKYTRPAEKAETGCITDGGTNTADLLKCLEQIKEKDEVGNIYIMNADSAHHFSYPLTKMAFEASNKKDEKNKKKKKVVVNIDNHRDYGINRPDPTGSTISCGSWGSYHVAYWGLKGECAGGEYVTLSNGTEQVANAVYTFNKGDKAAVKKELDDKQAFEHLKSYTEEGHEIYFTVDRDFMKGNGTKYNTDDGKCKRTVEQGRKFVQEILGYLKGSTIIHADIIGLPTNGQDAGAKVMDAQYTEACGDVKSFIEAVKKAMK